MPRTRTIIPFVAIVKYRELWLRLCDIFPVLATDAERSGDITISFENYRYKAVVDGDGYMVWAVPSSPSFWEKAILPILAEYKAERITWSTHRYNPRVFLVKLPLSSSGVTHFREWVASGSTNTETFVRESIYDNDGWESYEDDCDWELYYDNDLDNEEALQEEVRERFERKTRRKRA